MTLLTCPSPQPHAKNNFPHGARWPQSVAIQSTELIGQVHSRNSTKFNHNDGNSGPWLANKIVEKLAKLISGQQTKRTAAVYDMSNSTGRDYIWQRQSLKTKKRKINTAHETRVTHAEAHTHHLGYRYAWWQTDYRVLKRWKCLSNGTVQF